MLPIGPEDGYASMTFVVAGGNTYGAGYDTPAHSNVYTCVSNQVGETVSASSRPGWTAVLCGGVSAVA
jgi:hypothetical protein